MFKKIYLCFFLILCCLVASADVRADETELFSSVQPDALILLDLSGSMSYLPNGTSSGSKLYTTTGGSCSADGPFYTSSATGHTKGCTRSSYGTFPVYSSEACTEPYYKTSTTDHPYNCTKVQIAKRAIFDLLDDDNDGTISSLDMTSLGVRIGYMRFYGTGSSDESTVDYTSGYNKLIQGITTSTDAITPYSAIYCGSGATTCTSSVTSCTPSTTTCVAGIAASGNTPLITAMSEIKQYLDVHKASDTSRTCRKKFAIIISDGEDTVWSCSSGTTTYIKRHRQAVLQAKMLADAGYSTFIVGFGSMEPYLQNVLNWMAYYGGTDNPLVANSALPSPAFDTTMDACAADSSYNDPANLLRAVNGYGVVDYNYAVAELTGYAFFANNASELTQALKYSFSLIKEATYSFSATVSVAASRTADENYIYAASFQPVNSEPFWPGYLKKYQLADDGSVGSQLWDAGSVLASTAAGDRNIWTYKSGAITAFNTTNMTYADLNIDDSDATTAAAAKSLVVGFIRGESTYNIESWKLGDIFRSNPVSVPTPSSYFYDTRDSNSAFSTFRTTYPRTTTNGLRLILIGANDGQFHAFQTNTGTEAWSFIPPNFLPKLINIAHNSHPTGLTHLYFVDGLTTVADAWLGSGTGTAKSASDWRTLAIFGEGRGVGPNIWSSSSSCDTDFKSVYTTGYGNFCGYHALDVTNTMGASPYQPTYKWHLTPSAADALALGEPWSKFIVTRVIIGGQERWVGFIGAGYNAGNCTSEPCDKRGKGFFVIDLRDGSTVWSFTHDGSGYTGSGDMDFSAPANPLVIDADGDGFADTAYIGDIGGNMWRFRFCSSSDATTCSTSNWRGSRLYQRTSGSALTVYTAPTAGKDPSGNLWIYWGSGDKVNPVDTTVTNAFFAVKDNDFTSTWALSDLEDISSSTYTDSSSKHGWTFNLSTGGEKVLYDPTLYAGIVYFTTYIPDQSGDPCSQAGTSYLYGINYLTGAGMLSTGSGTTTARSSYIGTGMASGVVISQSATGTTTLYNVLNSTIQGTTVPTTSSMSNILYWRDARIK